ncbi:lysosomal Pro-X carboxypeptidase isoform X2 [Plodia interpunctella]|uniref:lysosomal Pro-X carboxypeptidase isoform X2 n=1 Tax=Plodia interpunctella TaxID=58824 RepID=UPI0023689F44|nr:lysosomal Pro-X carboxypeptidase isoform X2 [Plodia interpunctella]
MWRFNYIVYTVITFALSFANSEYTYETKWFTVPLDHFSFQRNETFKIKYLVNDTYWDRSRGPIFFYTGNEGQIEQFAKYTGFIWENAEEFKAKIVFAEHRYYGGSMPFGNKSLDNEHIGYLTAAQALADYADLVDYLQGGAQKPHYPVIAFGGSYGGMLAAYFRMKYPHLVTGAIAASAPVHMFTGMVPCDVFDRIVTSSFSFAGDKKNCSANIKASWKVLRNFITSKNNTDWLKTEWRLCDAVNTTNIKSLIDYLKDMYTNMAMVNYPYESSFLMPLPANPVRSACQFLNKELEGTDLLKAVGKVLEMYTNYDKNNKCVDFKSDNYGNLDASGWDYQACTEMVMPMCTNETDMFEASTWNFSSYSEDCHKKYNVFPRPDAARIQYGGDRLQAATNIVFSNGLLDPWAGGGILNSVSPSTIAVIIINTAHHLDLMPSNKNDPKTVRMTRNIHKQQINKWIREFWK